MMNPAKGAQGGDHGGLNAWHRASRNIRISRGRDRARIRGSRDRHGAEHGEARETRVTAAA